jgi:hypothetical protein
MGHPQATSPSNPHGISRCFPLGLKVAAYPASQSFVLGRECMRNAMSETHVTTTEHDQPWQCEIRIQGHLDDRWADWFVGLTITREDNGETRLTGPVVDQAALHGLLKKVRDLGLPLVSVNRIEPDQADAAQPAATDVKQ